MFPSNNPVYYVSAYLQLFGEERDQIFLVFVSLQYPKKSEGEQRGARSLEK